MQFERLGMDTSMNGRPIAAVWWPGNEFRYIKADPEQGHEIVLAATHHGDRDEFWIVEKVNGKETQRHNPRYVETIIWKDL